HDGQALVRLDLELDRPGVAPPRGRGRTDRARPEPRARPSRGPVVGRRAHDRDVRAARGQALLVRAQRQLVERPADVALGPGVLVPVLAELVLVPKLALLQPEVGPLAHQPETTRARRGASAAPPRTR